MTPMLSYLRRNFWSRRSLGQRVLLSFIFFIAVVALCYASAVITTLEYTERGLMTRVMHEEISRSETALQAGFAPRLPTSKPAPGRRFSNPFPPTRATRPKGFPNSKSRPSSFS